MNTLKRAFALLAVLLAGWQISLATPAGAGTAEDQIMAFLWNSPGSSDEKAELVYNVVEDAYNTRITFNRDKTFKASDGMGGLWSLEGGKLLLTTLDIKDGFTIKFDYSKLSNDQLKGIVTTKGKWHGRHVVLKRVPK